MAILDRRRSPPSGNSRRCRRGLLAGATYALCLAAGARADPLTISNGVTTPVATAAAANATPGDITVDSGGSVKLSSGNAVTINSSNTVENSGTIQSAGSNSAAVLIDGSGPIDMTLNNEGTISVTGTNDSNDYGIRLTGGPVSGTITSTSAGSISVDGTNSIGVSIESPFNGGITLNNVTTTGANSTAISISAPVSGNILLTGASGASVAGGTGFVSTAPIGGSLTNIGSLSAGAAQTTNSSGNVVGAVAGVAAMWIGGSVGGGVINDRHYVDSNGNIIPDAQATSSDTLLTGTLSGVGAPGLLIQPNAASPQNIELSSAGTGDDDFGLVNRGSLSSTSDFVGSAAVALNISGAVINSTHYTTQIDNGLVSQANASISASSLAGPATGINIGAGATVPLIRNEGTINAAVNNSSQNGGSAYGIWVNAGANVPAVTNTGTITAAGIGTGSFGYGILDSSGTLATVTNSGTIQATAAFGVTTRAIDLSAGTEAETVNNSGTIVGDVLFGNGGGTYSATSGSLTGNLSYGSGSNALLLAGSTVFSSPISVASGGSVALSLVDNSVLDLSQSLPLSSVTATGQSTLIVPVLSGGTPLTVSGTASFTGQSKVLIDILTPNIAPTVTVFTANGGLTTDHAATLLDLTSSPFIYTLTGDSVTANSIIVSLQQKTAAQVGFAPGLAPLFDQSFPAMGSSAAFDAVANLSDQKSVLAAYRQIEPGNYGTALLRVAQSMESAAASQVQARSDMLLWAPPKGGMDGWPLGFWVQQNAQFLRKTDSQTDPGFRGTLWGFSMGVDHLIGHGLFAGIALSFDWAQLNIDGVATNSGDPLRQAGQTIEVYGGGHRGPLFAQVSVSAGHDHYDGDRAITIADLTAAKSAKWSGSQIAAQATVGGRFRFGHAWIEPADTFSYLRLHQNGYSESGASVLDLAVGPQTLNGNTNAAKLSAGYGVPMADGSITLEARGSYVSQLDRTPAALNVNYISGGTPFVLTTDRLPSHEIKEGMTLAYQPSENSWRFALNGDHEKYQGFSDSGVAVTARVGF